MLVGMNNDANLDAPVQRNQASRRSILAASLAGVGALLGAPLLGSRRSIAGAQVPAAVARKRSLRVAHLTDVHVQPERDGGDGLTACLHHIQSQKDTPSLILNTGDSVMDSFGKDQARTDLQWSLWQKVSKGENSLPMQSCLGNHDIWGWNKKKSKTLGTEALWGKQRGLDALGLAKPYHSFDRDDWHFVMLDSVVPFDTAGYRAKLDEEQFDWLASDLAANAGKHTIVASHIPIFSPAGVLRSCGESKATPGALESSGGATHLDMRRLHELFLRSGNVRACLSGHLHLIDRAEFCGVTYLSNPAVSGNWWKGKHLGRFGEMYTVLDLYDDGTFDVDYVEYGWKARTLPNDPPLESYPAPATRPAAVGD